MCVWLEWWGGAIDRLDFCRHTNRIRFWCIISVMSSAMSHNGNSQQHQHKKRRKKTKFVNFRLYHRCSDAKETDSNDYQFALYADVKWISSLFTPIEVPLYARGSVHWMPSRAERKWQIFAFAEWNRWLLMTTLKCLTVYIFQSDTTATYAGVDKVALVFKFSHCFSPTYNRIVWRKCCCVKLSTTKNEYTPTPYVFLLNNFHVEAAAAAADADDDDKWWWWCRRL